MTSTPPRVLFVCLGNICRSPMAEGVFRNLAAREGLEVVIDSAGTSDFHLGHAPDRRARATLRAKGIDISNLRARQFTRDDFARFDYILGMDRMNLGDLQRLVPKDYAGTVGLFLDYAPGADTNEVPDPYYGNDDGFDRVYNLIDAASRGLLADIRGRHSSSSSGQGGSPSE